MSDPRRPDLRLLPVAAGAWVVCGIATGQQIVWAVTLAVLVGLLAVIAALCRRPLVLAVALVALALGGMGWARSTALHSSAVATFAGTEATVTVEVEITADPRVSGNGFAERVIVAARASQVTGRGATVHTSVPVVLMADPSSELAHAVVGSQWHVSGRARTPDLGANVAALIQVRDASLRAPPSAGWQLIERVRAGLREAVQDRPSEPRAFVPALVLGDTSRIEPELTADFATTGLTHLTAVSGANLTLLIAFLATMARWCGVRGHWLMVLSLGAVAVFVALCRTEPSVLRATAMGLVALAAIGRGSESGRGIRQLCVAMIALLILDPWLSRSAGFALSVLATGGIIWWGRIWAERLRWLPAVIAEAIAVPLAAQVATQPVVSALSGSFSISGLLANAVAGPLVGPATVAGFAAAGLSLIHPTLAAIGGWVASWPAWGIIAIAHGMAALPGASITLPGSWIAWGWVGASSIVAVWWIPRVLARRVLAVGAAVVMVLCLVRAPSQPGWPPNHWVVAMCDVGQGDAAVVKVGPESAVLVDLGPEPQLLSRCLDQLGVKQIPLVILSHFHADHVGGLPALAERRVGMVMVSPARVPADAAAGVEQDLTRMGIPHRTTLAGELVSIGREQRPGTEGVTTQPVLTWQTLWPDAEAAHRLAAAGEFDTGEGESAAENDASVVGRLTVAGVSILFTGDIEPTGQTELLRRGVDLRADILKVPHHGSRRQEPAFFSAVQPRWAMVSAGENNSYGHPAAPTVRMIVGSGITLLRTDQSGGVAISRDQFGWHATSQR